MEHEAEIKRLRDELEAMRTQRDYALDEVRGMGQRVIYAGDVLASLVRDTKAVIDSVKKQNELMEQLVGKLTAEAGDRMELWHHGREKAKESHRLGQGPARADERHGVVEEAEGPGLEGQVRADQAGHSGVPSARAAGERGGAQDGDAGAAQEEDDPRRDR